jgi:hypothetical protein
MSCLSDRPLVQRASAQLTSLRPRRRRHLMSGGQRSLLLQLRWLPPQVRDGTWNHRRALHILLERAIAQSVLCFQAVVAMTMTTTAGTGERPCRREAVLAAPPVVCDKTGDRRRTLHTDNVLAGARRVWQRRPWLATKPATAEGRCTHRSSKRARCSLSMPEGISKPPHR